MNKPLLTRAAPVNPDAADLLAQVRACTRCAAHLPLAPRPVFQCHPQARILVAAQAPGRKAHDSGTPFNDASGDRLRAWLGVDRATFYDERCIALLPMGFCYPGTGAGGDLPPRPECAAAWRAPLLSLLGERRLTLVIGQYALAWHLPRLRGSVSERVAAWRTLPPDTLALPHPSPRNQRWVAQRPWFEAEVLPELKRRVARALGD